MWPNPQETADLFTFTEDILNLKLHFLGSGYTNWADKNSNIITSVTIMIMLL